MQPKGLCLYVCATVDISTPEMMFCLFRILRSSQKWGCKKFHKMLMIFGKDAQNYFAIGLNNKYDNLNTFWATKYCILFSRGEIQQLKLRGPGHTNSLPRGGVLDPQVSV